MKYAHIISNNISSQLTTFQRENVYISYSDLYRFPFSLQYIQDMAFEMHKTIWKFHIENAENGLTNGFVQWEKYKMSNEKHEKNICVSSSW